jgi:hypothetical protein
MQLLDEAATRQEKHQQFSFYPCGSGFPTAKNRGKMPLTQYLEANPSA